MIDISGVNLTAEKSVVSDGEIADNGIKPVYFYKQADGYGEYLKECICVYKEHCIQITRVHHPGVMDKRINVPEHLSAGEIKTF